MPISGLTTHNIPKPSRLGVLRKGAPKPENGKVPGKDLTYFRFDPDDPKDTALVEALEAEYGPEPNKIEVLLPFSAAEENFEAFQEQWNASQLIHRCDGVHLWERNVLGQLHNTRRPCPYGPEGQRPRTQKDPGCKQVGRLSVVVPAFIKGAGRFGLVTVLTTSIWDIVSISEALAFYQTMGGDLRGIPFVLSRVPREISTPTQDANKRARREKYLISLQPAPEWVSNRLEASRRLALAAPQEERLLVSNLVATEAEEEDDNTIEGTFQPSPASWVDAFYDTALGYGYTDREAVNVALKNMGYASLKREQRDDMLRDLEGAKANGARAEAYQREIEAVRAEEPEPESPF